MLGFIKNVFIAINFLVSIHWIQSQWNVFQCIINLILLAIDSTGDYYNNSKIYW